MIIDSHCHLDYEPIYSNLDDVIKRAQKSNVKFMLTISVEDKKYEVILNILKNFQMFLVLMEYILMKQKIIKILIKI